MVLIAYSFFMSRWVGAFHETFFVVVNELFRTTASVERFIASCRTWSMVVNELVRTSHKVMLDYT